MTTIRSVPPTALRPSAASVDQPTTVPSAQPVDTVAEDHFVRAAPRPPQLVAGTPLGIAAAFVLNGVAVLTGVSHTMTGFGSPPVLPRPTPTPTELVVRRGRGGA